MPSSCQGAPRGGGRDARVGDAVRLDSPLSWRLPAPAASARCPVWCRTGLGGIPLANGANASLQGAGSLVKERPLALLAHVEQSSIQSAELGAGPLPRRPRPVKANLAGSSRIQGNGRAAAQRENVQLGAEAAPGRPLLVDHSDGRFTRRTSPAEAPGRLERNRRARMFGFRLVGQNGGVSRSV